MEFTVALYCSKKHNSLISPPEIQWSLLQYKEEGTQQLIGTIKEPAKQIRRKNTFSSKIEMRALPCQSTLLFEKHRSQREQSS